LESLGSAEAGDRRMDVTSQGEKGGPGCCATTALAKTDARKRVEKRRRGGLEGTRERKYRAMIGVELQDCAPAWTLVTASWLPLSLRLYECCLLRPAARFRASVLQTLCAASSGRSTRLKGAATQPPAIQMRSDGTTSAGTRNLFGRGGKDAARPARGCCV